MGNDVVKYNHISADPQNFETLFERQMSLADDVRASRLEVNSAEAAAKSYYGAVKTLETDLRARIFQHRVESRQPRLPGSDERSSGELGDGTGNQ